MADGLKKFSFHVKGGPPGGELESLGANFLESLTATRADDSGGRRTFDSDEAAARFYLNAVFSSVSTLESLAAPGEPGHVPELRKVDVKEQPLTRTRLVIFQQEKSRIPIFGSNVVVELDEARNIVSANAAVGEIAGVSALAGLSPAGAAVKIGDFTGRSLNPAALEAPELTFYHDRATETWHLAYYFRNVPLPPPEADAADEDLQGFGHAGPSPRSFVPLYDYLVDAHNGAILLDFSAQPTFDIPVQCRGLDEENVSQSFWGRRAGKQFELSDPLRAIKTYDLNFQELDVDAIPAQPIAGASADWGPHHRAAISAHVNAMRVYDFYKSELKRDGIDDKGMELISVVNCTHARSQSPPEWPNAVWWNNRMWYGQVQSNGRLRSFSRYLDVIAHEMTHGVTKSTADLVYKNESGALNESLSDIFGIIIRNWWEQGPDSDVSSWNWVLGANLGDQGEDMRDLRNPGRLTFDGRIIGQSGRLAYPDHMDDYFLVSGDKGGVHINSSIHNKAAYNVLTIGNDLGERVFTPREVAILYYLTLTRLSRLADFYDTLQIMVDVASTFYSGDEDVMAEKVAAIKRAYEGVGIRLHSP